MFSRLHVRDWYVQPEDSQPGSVPENTRMNSWFATNWRGYFVLKNEWECLVLYDHTLNYSTNF